MGLVITYARRLAEITLIAMHTAQVTGSDQCALKASVVVSMLLYAVV